MSKRGEFENLSNQDIKALGVLRISVAEARKVSNLPIVYARSPLPFKKDPVS
ncbi:hypothetical protein [Nostoc sp. LPT]|uniref:hypothetical protein n=1 Tax=Nostoc sp. LPT TaxID=2815387 RepID=UPI0025FBAC34|nr:hypothetical protein [Nostoc sp. LPT]